MDVPRDFDVLFRQFLGRVDYDKTNVRAPYRSERTHYAVLFQIFFDGTLPSDARRIDKDIFFITDFYAGVDCVARRACDVRNDDAVVSQKFVDKAAFPRVRFPDDCDFQRFFLFFRLVLPGKFHDFVQHVAKTFRLSSGNPDRLAESQLVKVVQQVLFVVIQLVHDKQNRLATFAKVCRDFVVFVREPRLSVKHKYDDVGGFDSNLRLRPDVRPHDVFGLDFKPSRIDERERVSAPFRIGVKPVAGNARGVFDNGYSLPDDSIEKR